MKTSVPAGLWIDHKEAVVVTLMGQHPRTMRIPSSVEKQPRRAGEPEAGHHPDMQAPSDPTREREYQGDLARYYDKVISSLPAADEVLIFGPGEAKNELKKRMEKCRNGRRALKVETTGKMTERQVVAHVREHFHHPAPRGGGRLSRFQS